MSELSSLKWLGTTSGEVDAKPSRLPDFLWPSPPIGEYPQPTPLVHPEGCEIVGLNDTMRAGRLIFFVPEEGLAHVQVPPSRTTMPLRFRQFKSLTLTTPLKPASLDAMMVVASRMAFKVSLVSGGEIAGETIGHIEDAHGLFFFPPVDDAGAVHRMFVPRSAFIRFEVTSRAGDIGGGHAKKAAASPERMALQEISTPDQLLLAIDSQSKMPVVRIGEALLTLGMITQLQLDSALAQQQTQRGVPLGELLITMGFVSREDMQMALSRKMGYPFVNTAKFPVEEEALRKVAYAMATRLKVLPLMIRNGKLVIAMDDPARRRSAVDEIEFAVQLKAVPVLAPAEGFDHVLLVAYEKIGAAQAARFGALPNEMAPVFDEGDTDKLVETLEKEGLESNPAEDDRQIEQSDNSLVRLINNMIIEAHKGGVSDIHIESYPGREKIKVRFRRDGQMRTHLELPHNYRSALIARLKIMCDLDISERRKPQDGKINFAKFSPQHKLELRVATIPTNNGLEDVVMRILASAKPIPLEKLGLSPYNMTGLKQAMGRPYGLVLCVGPTGSGKTTTLHSALAYINTPERKIWTAEDPVEITQAGLRQVQVNPKIEWTFAKALRAFLRADPDVIMVGEIRDGETSQMAVEASLTGHLVLSTLHTNSAPETVTRLLDMGMDPFNFADSLLAVLAQRLVRRLCSACRVSEPATQEQIDELLDDYLHVGPSDDPRFSRETVRAGWLERFAVDGRLMHFHSPGCSVCENSGQKGRAGLHELMMMSRELRHLIQTGTRAEELQGVALVQGMRTLRQDGIEKVLQGVTSIEEVRSTSNA
ncbi:MAG: pilus assembly protein PilB [Rhizobacter sp.]|nr:pilus assembly protein PilB [Rhizobacter sp.]